MCHKMEDPSKFFHLIKNQSATYKTHKAEEDKGKKDDVSKMDAIV